MNVVCNTCGEGVDASYGRFECSRCAKQWADGCAHCGGGIGPREDYTRKDEHYYHTTCLTVQDKCVLCGTYIQEVFLHLRGHNYCLPCAVLKMTARPIVWKETA